MVQINLSSSRRLPPLMVESRRRQRLVFVAITVLCIGSLTWFSAILRDTPSLQYDERNLANLRVGSEYNKCSWYLAPSSIPGAGGLGIFTTKHIAKGSRLFKHIDGPTVVIQDPDVQNHGRRPIWVDKVFMWTIRRHYYKESQSGFETSPNLGVMVNHHDVLASMVADRDDEEYNDSLLDRFKDPGAGAISYHTGRFFTTIRDVAPGEEIFMYDGEDYIRRHIKRAGGDTSSIPYVKDYEAAGKALEQLKEKAEIERTEVNDAALSELRKHVASRSSLAASLLPKTVKDFASMLKIKKMEPYLDYRQVVGRHSLLDRPLTWLEENGRCLDNVVPGRSTIHQAGQGAFATRFLSKGEVVVPIPLLVQVTDRETLNMYKLETDSDGKTIAVGDPIGRQLLENYCYGHEQSSLLLCAGSNANLINHCSSRTEGGPCGRNGANAELRWARDFDPSTSEWLGKTLEQVRDLVSKGLRGLTMEAVATRNIRPGEEVFLDYGVAWEAAWAAHVKNWKPPAPGSGFDDYASVTAMNQRQAPLKIREAYPANIITQCKHLWGAYYPCEVIERNPLKNNTGDSQVTYTAKISQVDGNGEEQVLKKAVIKTDLKRNEIRFSMKKYSSDEHLPGAFRHYIGVPHDLWPEQWKDLAS